MKVHIYKDLQALKNKARKSLGDNKLGQVAEQKFLVRNIFDLMKAYPPQMLVNGFLPRNGSIIVAGETFVGKTFFALELARSVMTGTPFLGQYPTQQGRVLLIEADSPEWDLRQQYAKVIGLPEDVPIEVLHEQEYEMFKYITAPVKFLDSYEEAKIIIDAHNNDIWVEEWYTEDPEDPEGHLLNSRTWRGYDLIIIDTLKAVHSKDENSNSDMHQVALYARQISIETGAAVVVLHHFNKGNNPQQSLVDRLRGATAYAGAVDGIFALTRPDRQKEEVKVLIAKNRAAPHMKDFSYRQIDKGERIVLSLVSDTKIGEFEENMIYSLKHSPGGIKTSDLRLAAISYYEGAEKEVQIPTIERRLYKLLEKLEKEQLITRSYGIVKWSIKEEESV